MEGRRVVVTGMGTISPVGNSVSEAWDSLVSGRSGIGHITYFNTDEYKAKLDAEVKDFNPRDWMEKAEVLRTDRNVQYAIAAAQQADGSCERQTDGPLGQGAQHQQKGQSQGKDAALPNETLHGMGPPRHSNAVDRQPQVVLMALS